MAKVPIKIAEMAIALFASLSVSDIPPTIIPTNGTMAPTHKMPCTLRNTGILSTKKSGVEPIAIDTQQKMLDERESIKAIMGSFDFDRS